MIVSLGVIVWVWSTWVILELLDELGVMAHIRNGIGSKAQLLCGMGHMDARAHMQSRAMFTNTQLS
jgi:hypothetical protein